MISAVLIGDSLQNQDAAMPQKIKTAFGKVSAGAAKLKQALDTVSFHPGACLIGGEMAQGASMFYTITVREPGDYGVIMGASINDANVEIVVKDGTGKNVVSGADEDGADFPAQAGSYTISAKNNGSAAFVALGFVRDEGGANHPFSSINTAANAYAASLQDTYQYGWGVPTGSLMVVGSVLSPGASYSRVAKFNFAKWLILAVSDAGPQSFSLTVTDKSANKTVPGVVDNKYSYSEFNMATDNASIVVKNSGSKTILALNALMR